MSHVELSSVTKSLLRAAKVDAPNPAARAAIWNGVATSAHLGASTAPGAMTTTATAGAASKLPLLGLLFGGAITVGLAIALLYAKPADAPRPRTDVRHEASFSGGGSRGTLHEVTSNEVFSRDPTASAPIDTTASVAIVVRRQAPVPASGPTEAVEDSLMREASLVAEARGALARGDAAGALRSLRAAESLAQRQLEPEELALESQALRATGKSDEAKTVGSALKTRFPDHALSR